MITVPIAYHSFYLQYIFKFPEIPLHNATVLPQFDYADIVYNTLSQL